MRRDKQERCDDCNRLVPERELRPVQLDMGRKWFCDDCYLSWRSRERHEEAMKRQAAMRRP